MANLITIANFQQQFACSRSTVNRLVRRGAFPLVRMGRSVRIRQADVDRWFASLPETPSSKAAED